MATPPTDSIGLEHDVVPNGARAVNRVDVIGEQRPPSPAVQARKERSVSTFALFPEASSSQVPDDDHNDRSTSHADESAGFTMVPSLGRVTSRTSAAFAAAAASCPMGRHDLQRLLARARHETDDDLFDCYFYLSDELAEGTVLCRACGRQIGQHGDTPPAGHPGSAGTLGWGSLHRAPRRPDVLDAAMTVEFGYQRLPLVGTLLGFACVLVAVLFIAFGSATPNGPIVFAVIGVVGLAMMLIGGVMATSSTVTFSTEAAEVVHSRRRLAFPCVSKTRRWSFRDVVGVIVAPDGARASDPDTRMNSSARASRYMSYRVVLELRAPLVDDKVGRAVVTKTVAPSDASGVDEDDDPQAGGNLPTEVMALQHGVPRERIAQIEADWTYFVTNLTDPF